MPLAPLLARRLQAQHLVGARFTAPAEAVAWFGAVQSQDHPAAKWGLAQRVEGCTDAAIEEALASGEILRTHVLRPTWHYVARADLRWMLALTAERIHAADAYRRRQLGLDAKVFARFHAVLGDALGGGKHLTRTELAKAAAKAKLEGNEVMAHLLMHAELEALVCSGAPRGKQHTYALLDERVPASKPMPRERALAELARRYFTSHGPATLKDFAWWSGLTVAEARAGAQGAKEHLVEEELDGERYWRAPQAAADAKGGVHLLPNYDEYLVAYADRRALVPDVSAEKLGPRANVLFNHTLVVEGRVAGLWTRTLGSREVEIALTPFGPLSRPVRSALAAAAERYGAFLERAPKLVVR